MEALAQLFGMQSYINLMKSSMFCSRQVGFCAFCEVACTGQSLFITQTLGEFAGKWLYSTQQDDGGSGGEISSGYVYNHYLYCRTIILNNSSLHCTVQTPTDRFFTWAYEKHNWSHVEGNGLQTAVVLKEYIKKLQCLYCSVKRASGLEK